MAGKMTNTAKKQASSARSKRVAFQDETTVISGDERQTKKLKAPHHVEPRSWIKLIAASLALICASELAGIASQMSLSPIYGEIPSGLYHKLYTTILSCVAVFAPILVKTISSKHHNVLLRAITNQSSLLALHIPLLLPWLWKATENLGPVWGPIVVESASFFPLRYMLLYRATSLFIPMVKSPIGLLNLTISQLVVMPFIFKLAFDLLFAPHIGEYWITSRCGLHYIVAFLVSCNSSWKNLALSLPGLLIPLQASSFCAITGGIELANVKLQGLNHTLLARTDSITGHVSIMENNHLGYRFMRCDHSILGGEWLQRPTPDGLREPIYAVFVMLEAVRLVEPHALQRKDPEALVIGLGIGTSASGLIKHGVPTTIVELDPAVYHYAKEYFDLPLNHTAHITNAIDYVQKEEQLQSNGQAIKKYDYILHDVFTGGAVPAALFTSEFLNSTKSLLKNDGVIAINYAGDINLSVAQSVIRTILLVFTHCRAFRDIPREGDHKVDFVNMVIFCTPFQEQASTDEKHPYFHKPQTADFHQTYIRQEYLYPQFEVDLTNIMDKKQLDSDSQIITVDNVGILTEWQKESAVSHWGIMNGVMPPGAWRIY